MIRWCSHCQKYLGEKPPLDDYTLTHTICPDCAAKLLDDDQISPQIRAVADFYKEILSASKHGPLPSVSEIITRGRELNLRPQDLLMGILQPALYEVGKAWECGEIMVEAEHRFSSLVQAITSFVAGEDESSKHLRDAASPDVLLIAAEGNNHSLGIAMTEAFLVLHRVSSKTCTEIAPYEALKLTAQLKPRIVGISLAMPGQEGTLRIFNDWLATQPVKNRPICVAGGRWTRQYTEDKFGLIEIARSPEAILHFLQLKQKA